MIGRDIAHYRIENLIGAGGMGEVYRARDTRLGRNVAVKVLPEIFARDPDRVARFEREAKLLAGLNHANIAALYGLEESGGQHFLVMELVDGVTLAERIARGPIPVEETLKIAHQIAEAFEAAHEKGVIHRDLKPANVKITPEGKVKVLDFGLAKALETAPTEAISNSPTLLSAAATNGGIILGTAGYMSPEQARGHNADQRSDIFSFGCVLFEMLTGRQPFQGDTISDVIASVLAREPDLRAIPGNIHPKIEELIRRCLEKDRKRRWHSIADVRVEIEAILTDPHGLRTGREIQPRSLRRRAVPFLITATLAALVAVILTVEVTKTRPSSAPGITRFALLLPETQHLTLGTARHIIAISPDGRRIVYIADQELYVRNMEEMEARSILRTGQLITTPFFSPDGRWVAFYTEGRIKKIDVAGGPVVNLCDVGAAYGATWSSSGEIYVGQGPNGIIKCSENGSKPQRAVMVKPGEGASSPQLLPDGDTLLYTLGTGEGGQIVIQSLKSGERKILGEGDDARFVATGHIVYTVGSTLLAAPFDVRKLQLTGGAVPFFEDVMGSSNSHTAQFSIASNGSMVYIPQNAGIGTEARTLALVDRTGSRRQLDIPPGPYNTPRISPDGKQLTLYTDDGRDRIVWVYDLTSGAPLRQLTFGGNNHRPVWNHDNQRITFTSNRQREWGLFRQRADGTGSEERLAKIEQGGPQSESWSRDDKVLIFSMPGPPRSLWMLAPETDPKPKVLIGSPTYSVSNATISNDGHWLAYFSAETGQQEVYVQPFPLSPAKYRISTGGGLDPVWSPDGKQLFYTKGPAVGARQIFAVDVQTQPTFIVGKTTPLPIEGIISTGPRSYDITPDGKFVVMLPSSQAQGGKASAQQFYVTLNWFEELKQRVPVK
jgi:eukaryotic-like serine/threonine-protein kinase